MSAVVIPSASAAPFCVVTTWWGVVVILSIASKPLPGDPQSCVFDGANVTSITISVRPGLGDVSVGEWISGKVPVPGETVNGIGDKAVWQDTLRELIATKHNVLCDIQATGANGSSADVQKKFAALCGKIWAAQ